MRKKASARQSFQEADALALRWRYQTTVPHDFVSAYDSPHRPAGNGDAVIGRPADARGDPAVGDGLAPLEIDHRKVGVIADRDAALGRDAEQPRRARAGEIDQPRERQPAGIDVVE